MEFSITYIYHNCFVLKTGEKSYLFDYPNDSHLPENGEELVQNAVAGTELSVFVSHSHDDHLNDDISTMVCTAKSVRYILSDDVKDMRPGVIPFDRNVLIVEPDEVYDFGGMRIETLMSNDLGVAFLVEDDGLRFYYGGDLAKWIWKSATAQEREFTTSFFHEAMNRARAFCPHVAFSNVDRRLENLAGGVEAYRQSGAQVFVPMHTFGDTHWLHEFRENVGEEFAKIFIYNNPGESADFSV